MIASPHRWPSNAEGFLCHENGNTGFHEKNLQCHQCDDKVGIMPTLCFQFRYSMAGSRFVPCQWETALLRNNISHWQGASLETALHSVILGLLQPSTRWPISKSYTTLGMLLQICLQGTSLFEKNRAWVTEWGTGVLRGHRTGRGESSWVVTGKVESSLKIRGQIKPISLLHGRELWLALIMIVLLKWWILL